MGRRKIEIKAIKDDRNRSVTFLKRKGGLFKKAHELSVLCSVDVAVIIFGHNKKLYEFSSGDINEIIGRYQYYGNPHEHKGPADFNGGKDEEEEEEEMGSPPPESHSSQDPAPLMPVHILHDQPPYQHMRHQTPSASPPVANGSPFHARQHTPQAQSHISRPTSRNTNRRMSSNLMPQQQTLTNPQHQVQQHPQSHSTMHQLPHITQSQGPPSHNGFSYMSNTQMPNSQIPYHPHAVPAILPQPDSSQASNYQSYPAQSAQMAQPSQAYLSEQHRRTSMPPVFGSERAPPMGGSSPSSPARQLDPPSLMPEPKRSGKSYSIFTPVDAPHSFLMHMMTSKPAFTPDKANEPSIKEELTMVDSPSDRPRSADGGTSIRTTGGHISGPGAPPPRFERQATHTRGSTSMSSLPEMDPPRRTNSAQWMSAQGGKRPQLKVQIPDESSEGSGEVDCSPRGSSGTAGGAPSARGAGTEGSHSSGVVLPPPSPSASALLSAGTGGPPNPFARPNPPSSTAQNNNIETPISALPSRFLADTLLPSPSSLCPEWDFGRGRSNGESNLLPSPLNFQTPIMPGPSFLREEADSTKRKSPDTEGSDGGATKRMKT